MCYIQVKNIRLNSFYEEKKIKLCLTKQLLNMFKLWCEWGISLLMFSSVNQVMWMARPLKVIFSEMVILILN